MADPSRLLLIQFLHWIADRPRSYAEVMDAWRTSCPRLSIWEDATTDGLVRRDRLSGAVILTARGRATLDAATGRGPAAGEAAERRVAGAE